ncbi:hypothetical protein SRHO_G00293250 [Serrasalmus rhombeus]
MVRQSRSTTAQSGLTLHAAWRWRWCWGFSRLSSSAEAERNLDDTLHYWVEADGLTEALQSRWRGGDHSHVLYGGQEERTQSESRWHRQACPCEGA